MPLLPHALTVYPSAVGTQGATGLAASAPPIVLSTPAHRPWLHLAMAAWVASTPTPSSDPAAPDAR